MRLSGGNVGIFGDICLLGLGQFRVTGLGGFTYNLPREKKIAGIPGVTDRRLASPEQKNRDSWLGQSAR